MKTLTLHIVYSVPLSRLVMQLFFIDNSFLRIILKLFFKIINSVEPMIIVFVWMDGTNSFSILYFKTFHKKTQKYYEPRISAHTFSLDGELDLKKKNDLLIKKMTWNRHLFLFLFLKGKQNKKKRKF